MDLSNKLSTKEAAEYLGHSTYWLYAKRKALGIPHYVIGGYVYYLKEELDQWILGQQLPPKPSRGRKPNVGELEPIIL